MKSWKPEMVRRAVVVAAMGAALVVPAGAAHAAASSAASVTPMDTSCSAVFGCSRVTNHTHYIVTARHNWTCSSGSTGSSSTGCVSGGSFLVSGYGGSTPDGQDWDVLQIDAGYCYKVHFDNWYGKSWTETYDRRGTTNLYVKVEDGSTADVQGQSLTVCP